eukprot:scaffold3170_cov128-Cylindrotheca_fusiformis.AAC.6
MSSITRHQQQQKSLFESKAVTTTTSPLQSLTAQVFDKILSGSCTMCSTYLDQQIEFELTHEDDIRSMEGGVMQCHSMFDEDSVVESVSSRTEQI